jgi:hypothetical protein
MRPWRTSKSEFYASRAGAGDHSVMNTLAHQRIISLAEDSVIRPAPGDPNADADSRKFTRAGQEANFVIRPKLPVNIPDERLDYYAWVFTQRGFSNLEMTFEQFLTVVATVHPSGLYPEYNPTDSETNTSFERARRRFRGIGGP